MERADRCHGPKRGSTFRLTIAAQVNHVVFLVDSAMRNRGQELDWASSWNVSAVDDAAWQALVARLRERYAELRSFAGSFDAWDVAYVQGAFALLAHCAYHLGQFRAALGVSLTPDAT